MLQDSEVKGCLSGYSSTAYPADSRKVFFEVCNKALIAKKCERKRHNLQQKHSDKIKKFLHAHECNTKF